MQACKGQSGAPNRSQPVTSGGAKGTGSSTTQDSTTLSEKTSQSNQDSSHIIISHAPQNGGGARVPSEPKIGSDGGYGGSREVPRSDPIDIKRP
ncbi:hypothetical protein EKO27_g10160 [Xylaria grammica]|uniref:Uncharacterized protein n=1 Tax=Xylaria grammica TaxID=363999 RepID=A0A439CS23_9PEZI|nr:hypothetical protein EKO27_g10160 [Xylaria grammica]